MNMAGKKVLVMGLGVHGGGVGVSKWLLAQGAHVTVTDLKTRQELGASIREIEQFNASLRANRSNLRYVLGAHRLSDILHADLIVQNPGVPNDAPLLKLARAKRIPIVNDTSLFFEHCPWPIIGVTGTKGKTTTAMLLHAILNAHNHRTLLAGNLRISPLEFLLKNNNHKLPVIPPQRDPALAVANYQLPFTRFVVLELSSWNLEGLARIKRSPSLAVITNIMPDHLNRYASMRAYIDAKARIFQYQGEKDIVVLNRDNPATRALAKRAPGKVLWFSKKTTLPDTPSLLGAHNRQNIAAAVTAARALGVSEATIARALRSFNGVPGRLETVTTVNGIRYINDTTATTPEATIAALEALCSKEAPTSGSERSENASNKIGGIILIAGGGDKKLNYKALARGIEKHVKALVLFKGSASEKILSSLRGAKRRGNLVHSIITNLTTMRSAVAAARRHATPGDIILLSPGATSFGLFKHEFDRGDQFVARVKNTKGS